MMRQKFTKIKRDWNATEKNWIYINGSKKSWNLTKVDEFIVYSYKISLTFVKFSYDPLWRLWNLTKVNEVIVYYGKISLNFVKFCYDP